MSAALFFPDVAVTGKGGVGGFNERELKELVQSEEVRHRKPSVNPSPGSEA